MEYKDADGVVRGRYGYTDPNGKLRVVEYEAGPNGFVARGDVGPDSFPHDQTPETKLPQFERYAVEGLEHPRPAQMAGWDPIRDPIGDPVSSSNGDGTSSEEGNRSISGNSDENSTSGSPVSDATDVYIPVIDPYSVRYPFLPTTTVNSYFYS